MPYLAHTAHAQIGALPMSLVGWTLLAMSLGLVEWRVWTFPHTEAVSSGVAWIGVWKACFHTHNREEVTNGLLVMHCTSIDFREDFVPPEIAAAQFLLLLALGAGLLGNACGLYALRNAFFGIQPLTRLAFHVGGALTLAAAMLALIPLLWNTVAVFTNRAIAFPSEFQLPESPEAQEVGGGAWVGMMGAALQVVSAIIFISYKLPKGGSRGSQSRGGGRDNPAFEFDDVWL